MNKKSKKKMVVMIDTGDGDTDFILNNIIPGRQPDSRSPLVWLVRQQGHTMRELMEELSCPSEGSFLSSVRKEIEGCYFRMSTLTFLVTADKDIIGKIEKTVENEGRGGYIRLSKETACGLFNPWNGAGSMFGIRLERDVTIPVENIWSCGEDFSEPPSSDGIRRCWFGVDEVCGLPSDVWERGRLLETGGL